MQFINDTYEFIKTLEFFDILFFLAVLALMMLIISLVYFIKENNSEEDLNYTGNSYIPTKDSNNKTELESIKDIISTLEEADTSAISPNHYEVEQEEKAIISYEELIKKRNDFAINYSEEENITDDLTVRKVDLDNLINKEVTVKPKINVTVISYEKEEAFLEALKALQQKLN